MQNTKSNSILMPLSKFAQSYTKLQSPSDRLSYILSYKDYEVLNRCSITCSQIKAVLDRQFLGECVRLDDGYHISVMGDDDMNGYLTYHETMHIWLEENGFSKVEYVTSPKIGEHFFAVQNLVNDFLIEREISEKFGEFYALNVKYTKNKQIIGNLAMGNTLGSTLLIEGVLFLALASLYPAMKDATTYKIFSSYIVHPNAMLIVEKLLALDAKSITKEQYFNTIAEISYRLSAVECSIENRNRVSVENEDKLSTWMDETNKEFDRLKGLFSMMIR